MKSDLKVHWVRIPKYRIWFWWEKLRFVCATCCGRLRWSFWARGYLAVSSGTITHEMIQEDVNEQEGETDRRPPEPPRLKAEVI